MVEGTNPVDPSSNDKAQEASQQSLLQNVNLFQHTLGSYKEAENDQSKIQNKKIMDGTMQLIQQGLSNMGDQLAAQGTQIQSDYNTYMDSGADTDYTQLTSDIDSLTESLGAGE